MQPLSHRLIEKIPLQPYQTGLVASTVLFGAYYLIELQAGVVQKTFSGEITSIGLRASLMLMVLAGYLPIAHWYLRHWTWQHLGELTRQFGLADERRVTGEGQLIPIGIIGGAAFIILFLILPDPGNILLQPRNWPFDYAVLVLVMVLAGWWMGRFSYELIWSAWQLNKMAVRLPALNLLDAEPNGPFTQHGVQSALLVVIMMSITAPVAVAPEGGLVGAAFNSALMLVLVMAALILPMRGIHKRIQAQKQDELAAVRRRIQRARDRLFSEAGDTDGELLALLAMESRIERVEEWPFGSGSLYRVGFYLLLGLGSWVGAALVEKMLESAL
jgi:hypothetical protein